MTMLVFSMQTSPYHATYTHAVPIAKYEVVFPSAHRHLYKPSTPTLQYLQLTRSDLLVS